MKNLLFMLGTWVLLGGCIERINPELPKSEPYLVVDGTITDQPGPYQITLRESVGFKQEDGSWSLPPVVGAQLSITDGGGTVTTLYEVEDGVFQTPDRFRGEVGQTYTLHITLENGRQYRSSSEQLWAAGADTLYAAYLTSDDPEERAHQLIAEVDVREGEAQFYRWTFDYYYQVNTEIQYPACCPTCYISKNSLNSIVIDKSQGGQQLRTVLVKVPYKARYKIMYWVEQYTLTEQAYNYWRLIDEQQNAVGGLFDPPPALIRGNLTSETDPDEVVLGYFQVAAYQRKKVFMYRDENDPVPIPMVIKGDCRQLADASVEEPEGWE
ncbi:protein of unknown function [Catalinimonas alkaloidigena]|uniref:DUF4249 domain-containing protein n=1 Tax=Catalinimonas alkaloidigena TaxID=1075417 RepID=A0A1G9JE91_9BACT|nr:DUF4249 domain-containing protein [Catalinimonas alkaloidigena]SDL35453.1 protein of unknown function [Catalinimonas alkaloidigena]